MAEQKNWAGSTYGSTWMHRQLVGALKFIDVRLLYLFSALFIVPVCCVTNASRRTSWHFFRRQMGYGRWRALWAVYRNHCMFSQTVIDRFAMFAGKRFRVEVEGMEWYNRLAALPEGFLQLSAHVGCYEVAGYTLVATTKRFNALVYGGEKATVMDGRREQFAHTNIRMIPVVPDMSHLFTVNEALANGETVSMPSDRVFGSPKTVEVAFVGSPAKFPMGPFSVATMRSLDVIAVNVMKTSLRGYTVYVTPLHYDKSLPRRQQTVQLAEAYAAELEKRVRQYPTQWYNFFEFWS